MKAEIVTAGFVLDGNKNILMLKRDKPPWVGYWMVPGGHVEDSEAPHEALIREIKEEAGIDVSIVDFHDEDMKKLKKIEHGIKRLPQPFLVQEEISGHKDHKHINLVYICKYSRNSFKSPESMKLKWMPLDEIKKTKTPYNVKLWSKKILERM